jgi:steroid 5-alpha reductase family enzyme
MANVKKIRRAAFALSLGVGLTLLWFIIEFIIRGMLLSPGEKPITNTLLITVFSLMVLAILIIALILLHSIRADETPFRMKNVRRLKAIALLLVAFEAYFHLFQWVMRKLPPPFPAESGDEFVSVLSFQVTDGGVILVAGLVVYCVSLVFEYGISLQQQADETL